LIESMVVLAPGTVIGAADIPADVLESYGSLLPVRLPQGDRGAAAMAGPEFEFILRTLMDLRLQVEELRRRLEQGDREIHRHPHGVEVFDVGEGTGVAIPVRAVAAVGGEEEVEPAAVVWRDGMTMADVEKATIATVLELEGGNRRRAAQVLGIGERTLYRKLKEFDLA